MGYCFLFHYLCEKTFSTNTFSFIDFLNLLGYHCFHMLAVKLFLKVEIVSKKRAPLKSVSDMLTCFLKCRVLDNLIYTTNFTACFFVETYQPFKKKKLNEMASFRNSFLDLHIAKSKAKNCSVNVSSKLQYNTGKT